MTVAMTWIWTGMVVLSLVFGLFTGNLDAVADAVMDGAASAVELSVSLACHPGSSRIGQRLSHHLSGYRQ